MGYVQVFAVTLLNCTRHTENSYCLVLLRPQQVNLPPLKHEPIFLTITLIGFLFFPELTLIGFHRMMRQKKGAQKKDKFGSVRLLAYPSSVRFLPRPLLCYLLLPSLSLSLLTALLSRYLPKCFITFSMSLAQWLPGKTKNADVSSLMVMGV